MNKAQIQKLIDSPPPSWEKMFKRYKLKKPTVDQLIDTVLEYTPSMASSGARGSAKYKVPAKVKKEAALGLQLAWQHNWTSDSGVGLVRAMQLLVRPKIWERSVRRMKAYFTRHRRDKKFKGFGSKTKPSRGYIAWLAWGGDSGKKWVDGLKLRNPIPTKKKTTIQKPSFPPFLTPVDYANCLDPIVTSYDTGKGGTAFVLKQGKKIPHPKPPKKGDRIKTYFQLHAMKSPENFYGTIQAKCPKTYQKLLKDATLQAQGSDRLGVRVGGPIFSLKESSGSGAVIAHRRALYQTDVVFTVSRSVICTLRNKGSKAPGGFVDGYYQGALTSKEHDILAHNWYHDRDNMLEQGFRQVVFEPRFNDTFLYQDQQIKGSWAYNAANVKAKLQYFKSGKESDKKAWDAIKREKPIYTAKEVYLLADPYKLAAPRAGGFPYLILAWGINASEDKWKYKVLTTGKGAAAKPPNCPKGKPPYTISRVMKKPKAKKK